LLQQFNRMTRRGRKRAGKTIGGIRLRSLPTPKIESCDVSMKYYLIFGVGLLLALSVVVLLHSLLRRGAPKTVLPARFLPRRVLCLIVVKIKTVKCSNKSKVNFSANLFCKRIKYIFDKVSCSLIAHLLM